MDDYQCACTPGDAEGSQALESATGCSQTGEGEEAGNGEGDQGSCCWQPRGEDADSEDALAEGSEVGKSGDCGKGRQTACRDWDRAEQDSSADSFVEGAGAGAETGGLEGGLMDLEGAAVEKQSKGVPSQDQDTVLLKEALGKQVSRGN